MLLDADEIRAGLTQLGAIATLHNETIHLVVLGGAAMVLGFQARLATRDIDVLMLPPPEAQHVRRWVQQVGHARGWADDWLNDAAKGFLVGVSEGPVLLTAPGIVVRRPSTAQLLAMKLCAWRDQTDIDDARRLLRELRGSDAAVVWSQVLPYLLRGRELKAQYAFEDLWEELHP